MSSEEITQAINDATLTIGIVGLGWMGLPTACLFVEAGAQVLGADVDPRIIELIRGGQSHSLDPNLDSIISRNIDERFLVTTNVREVAAKSDVILVIVPTAITNMHEPDYSAVERACKEVGFAMRKGSLLIVESTIGPGVTEGLIKNILESNSGFKAGADFGLAYSPIRAMAGSVVRDIRSYPKIVGGIDERSTEVAAAVLTSIVQAKIIRVRDAKTAETVKLFENVYRDVNIALASELASFCEKSGLDFMEVRKAAVTQPYCHLHMPRVGVGGHCIPYNPYFLIAEAEAVDVDLRLVRYARKVNDSTPSHIVELVTRGLEKCGKSVRRSTIAVLGISYRNDVKEARNSPSIEIIQRLMKKGAKVKIHDPFYSIKELGGMGFRGSESVEGAVEDVDCVLVAVGHNQFTTIKLNDIARLMRKPACLIDGWRIFDVKEAVEHNLSYFGVGLG